jgi:hypothetical protein
VSDQARSGEAGRLRFVDEREVDGRTAEVLAEARRVLHVPWTPDALLALAAHPAYLDLAWRSLGPSMETGGFLGSAMYVMEMARGAIREVYEPIYSPETLRARGLSEADLETAHRVLEAYGFLNPQLLLAVAALREAFDREEVGGKGRPEPRETTDAERRVETLAVRPLVDGALDASLEPVLEHVRAVLNLPFVPDEYRTLANWPPLLQEAWEELQHLHAYAPYRRRGRALVYYSLSGSRFLAVPLRANAAALREAGIPDGEIATIRETVKTFLTLLSTLTLTTAALEKALGVMPPPMEGPPPKR